MKLLVCIGFVLVLILAGTCTIAAEASPPPEENSALEALAHDPANAPALALGEMHPDAQDRNLYDKAVKAVRSTLRLHPDDTTLRIRYAELLFLQHTFYPAKGDSIRRATEESEIALKDDPANPAVADFFARPSVMNAQLKGLTAHQLAIVTTSIKNALRKVPGNINLLRALVRLQIGLGQATEAAALAGKLARISTTPAEALTLQGIAELAASNARTAHQLFTAALAQSAAAPVEAGAELGEAESLRQLGQPESAADALERARSLLAPTALDRRATDLGLPSPDEITWKLGKALASAGDVMRADHYLGAVGMRWHLSHTAFKLNQTGLTLYQSGELKSAQQAFAKAVELTPGDPIVIENAA